MPFTARDLRYHAEQSYPMLYAYLHRNAQRFLGNLKYDAFEVDTVVGHVVEQLVASPEIPPTCRYGFRVEARLVEREVRC